MYSCPKCGFAPLMGIDTDVDESRGLTKISGKKKVYTKSDKQSFYSGLLGYQKEKVVLMVTLLTHIEISFSCGRRAWINDLLHHHLKSWDL